MPTNMDALKAHRLARKRARQAIDAKIPKCRCGNCLSRERQASGIDHCPACDPKYPQHEED